MDPFTIAAIATAAVSLFDSANKLITDLSNDTVGTKNKILNKLAQYDLTAAEVNQVLDTISRKLAGVTNISYGVISDVLKKGTIEASQKLHNLSNRAKQVELKVSSGRSQVNNALDKINDYANTPGLERWSDKQPNSAKSDLHSASTNLSSQIDELNKIKQEI